MKFALLTLLSALVLTGQSARRAPSFALPDSKLAQHDILSYRGKVLLLDFMRTDCPRCGELAGTLEQLKREFGDRIVVLSIVTYPADNQTTVAKFAAANGLTTPMLFDCGQVTASYAKATPQSPTVHLPRLFVIGRDGSILHDFDYDEDEARLKPAPLSSLIRAVLK